MTRPTADTLLRVLAPLLGGLALGIVLQATDSRARLYTAASPGLVAAVAGLLATGVVAVVGLARRRAAAAAVAAAATAGEAAVRQVAEEAARDRLRFFMRLDHELKNPLTAIRAGLANIEQAGGLVLASAGTAAALASVSMQADRIARLVSDLRKLADLETQQIETAPVDLTGLLDEVAEAVAEIPAARERVIRVTVPRAPWPLPLVEGDREWPRTSPTVRRASSSSAQSPRRRCRAFTARRYRRPATRSPATHW